MIGVRVQVPPFPVIADCSDLYFLFSKSTDYYSLFNLKLSNIYCGIKLIAKTYHFIVFHEIYILLNWFEKSNIKWVCEKHIDFIVDETMFNNEVFAFLVRDIKSTMAYKR